MLTDRIQLHEERDSKCNHVNQKIQEQALDYLHRVDRSEAIPAKCSAIHKTATGAKYWSLLLKKHAGAQKSFLTSHFFMVLLNTYWIYSDCSEA